MAIDFLEYDRHENCVPLKPVDFNAHIAQEELAKAWLQANVRPVVIEEDPSTWELVEQKP